MDSEHRHELKQNEMIEWFKKAPAYMQENIWTILGVACIVLAVVIFIYGRAVKKQVTTDRNAETTQLMGSVKSTKIQAIQSQMQNQMPSEGLIDVAQKLELAAQKDGDSPASAIAYIKRGDVLRADLHYTMDQVDDAVIESQVEQARKSYEKGIELAGSNASIKAAGMLGLALCSEEIQAFDQAKQIYQEIVDDESFQGTIYPEQARIRLETIEDRYGPFVFVKQQKELPAIELPQGLEEGAEIETFDIVDDNPLK